MSLRCLGRLLALVLMGLLACTARAQSPLTTTYASNNGFSGQVTVYFDITLVSPVLITSFDVNSSLAAGGAVTMEVYITAAGVSYSGNEVNPSAWTIKSTGSGVAAGQNVPTALNCDTPFTMTPGTYGMAIIYTNPRYTDGNGSNQNYATGDGVMSVVCGAARNTTAPFTGGTAFSPRVFNGSIHYTPGDLAAIGACCLSDGSCTNVSGNDCLAAMGAPRGGGTTCPPTPACPQPGACCDTSLNCTFVLQSACTGGSLWIAGTCSPTNPCSTPPANDTCAGATILGAGPTAFPYTTTAANFSAGEDALSVSCNTGNTAGIKFSIWYTYSPTANGALTFTETGTQDVVWAVWTGASCPDSFTEPQALCTLTDTAQGISVTAGTPVYICVGRQGSTTALPTANLALSFDFIPAPANDACATATILGTGPTAFPYTSTLNNRGAGADAANVSCNTGSLSSVLFGVWYTYTASSAGVLTFTETGTQDAVWAVYTGASCPDGSTVPDQCQTADTAQSIALAAGQTVYFLLGKQGSATALPTADLAFSFNFLAAPANDLCGGAIALALKTPVTGELAAASNDYQVLNTNPPFIGVVQTLSTLPGRDVVYTFTPAITGAYTFRLQTNSANFGLFVTDTCPTGTSPIAIGNAPGGVIIAANRPTGTGVLAEEVFNVSLTSGTQYWVFVDQATAVGAGTFGLEVIQYSGEVEPNGDPASANTYSFGDSGVTGSINPAGEADFYSLGSPAAGSRIFALGDTLAGASNDTDMRITTATDTIERDDAGADTPFGSLSPICVGTPAPGGPLYIRMNGFTAGTLYEPYRLLAVVQPPASSAAAEVEPNDTSATASSNASNYFAGAMASTTDADFYSFTATAGEMIFIGLDANPNRNVATASNLLLDLRAADGTTVLVAVNDAGTACTNPFTPVAGLVGATPVSVGEALAWRARVTGTYYARVTASTVVAPGSYLLSITKHPVADPGACCTGTTCTFVAQSSCSGTFLGVGTTCSGTPCTPGACCLQAGGCSVVIPSQCASPNIFRGDASCPPSVACPATGACCNGTACSTTFQANCSFTWTSGQSCTPLNFCFPADECETTTLVANVGPATLTGNTTGATTSATPPTFSLCTTGTLVGSAGGNDLWANFTAPATASYTLDLCGSGYDTVLGIYSACPGSDSTLLACNDDSNQNTACTDSGLRSRIPSIALTAGTLYHVRIAGYAGAVGAYVLNIDYVDPSSIGSCCVSTTCTLTDAANCSGTHTPAGVCSPSPCVPSTENCCRGTTCNSITAGTCTGVVAGSNSLVVTTCGTGNALSTCCFADFNHDGIQSIDDLFLYFNAYFTASPWANVAGDGVATPTIDDLFLYINAYFSTCLP